MGFQIEQSAVSSLPANGGRTIQFLDLTHCILIAFRRGQRLSVGNLKCVKLSFFHLYSEVDGCLNRIRCKHRIGYQTLGRHGSGKLKGSHTLRILIPSLELPVCRILLIFNKGRLCGGGRQIALINRLLVLIGQRFGNRRSTLVEQLDVVGITGIVELGSVVFSSSSRSMLIPIRCYIMAVGKTSDGILIILRNSPSCAGNPVGVIQFVFTIQILQIISRRGNTFRLSLRRERILKCKGLIVLWHHINAGLIRSCAFHFKVTTGPGIRNVLAPPGFYRLSRCFVLAVAVCFLSANGFGSVVAVPVMII